MKEVAAKAAETSPIGTLSVRETYLLVKKEKQDFLSMQ